MLKLDIFALLFHYPHVAPVVAAAFSSGVGAAVSDKGNQVSAPAGNTDSSGGSVGGAQIGGSLIDSAASSGGLWSSPGIDPGGWLFKNRLRKKAERNAKKMWTKEFDENVRKYNLDYALKELAFRKNYDLNQLQMMYEQDMGRKGMKLQQAQVGSSLKSEAQSRASAEEQQGWLRNDRKKATKMSKAYSRGLVSGLFGRKNGK